VEGSVFGAVSLWFLFVCKISPELLNGFAPNLYVRRVWSIAPKSLKVRSPGKKRYFSALSAACMQLMFGKTSLASSFFCTEIFWSPYILLHHNMADYCDSANAIVNIMFIDLLLVFLKQNFEK